MLRSAELNTFGMANAIYRDLVCRARGGIYRLNGKTPWRYDGKASCMSKQIVILVLGTSLGDERSPVVRNFSTR